MQFLFGSEIFSPDKKTVPSKLFKELNTRNKLNEVAAVAILLIMSI